MTHSSKKRTFVLSAVAALLLAVAIPLTALAQGNGRGRGRGNGDWSNRSEHSRSNWDWRNRSARNRRHYDKKCGKFVNCHDARAGRWDGRGPRVGNNVWRNRFRNRNVNTWRYRNGRTARRVIVNQ
jgi:hypothetical protein